MVGERVYDHMHELHERGLVVAREHGQSKMVTTSDRFPEYFGIPETEPERIRTFLAEKLGIKVGPKQEKPSEVAAEGEPSSAAEPAPPVPGAAEPSGAVAEPAPPAEATSAPPEPTASQA